jgi:hypothetical protein
VLPTVAAGSGEAVVIPSTLMVKGTAPVVPATLSVTVTLKLSVPAATGVPESSPLVGFKLSPVPVSPVADHA